ncbi:ATP-binding protein [Ruania rhizosphaerae]|uniref:ATP-binding protein n=1 Tax=Ruania rhizosphaerae TaxID=1840413 RepID=UPI00135C3146|nr:DUF4143 domain-containing protein [Ruania rhizosphaerae]
MTGSTYTRRYVDDYLDRAMEHLSAFLITGPRACGKTTTALRRGASILRLDRPEEADLFAGQPDAYLSRLDRPTVIDEWQVSPESMGAVKRAVDAGAAPGSFLLTGSVRARQTSSVWPGTGRLIPVRMHGLTQGELTGSLPRAETFVDRLFEGDVEEGAIQDPPSVFDYIALAATGGFPEAIALPDDLRRDWFDGYVTQLAGRDIAEIADLRSPQALVRLLRALAANTAGSPTTTTLAEATRADHRTTMRYLDLLEEVGIAERLPPWTSNRLSRLVKLPKLHLTDTGLALRLLGLDAETASRTSDARGRLLDSFVAAQLRPLLGIGARNVTPHHLRESSGRREIDLLLESLAGELVGIEVKSSATVRKADARHLEWFRDMHGEAFRAGIVFHTGSMTVPLSERIWAMPIAAIWR